MGNIKTASNGTTTNTYTYGNTTWRDQLTKFNGVSLVYDSSGNPTTYYNGTTWAMTWEQGRQLASASDGSTTLNYTYDYTGQRTKKSVVTSEGTTNHHYTYASGKLLREVCGSTVMDFIYDGAGRPFALRYNGTLYYYILNLQGDVVHLANSSGTVVATYSYDPYGKIIAIVGGTIAEDNPLRYRGYYYDSESGMYYLQSRYYDPAICRFINADSYASTGHNIVGCNMYAYCVNNPINYFDDNGERIVGVGIQGEVEGGDTSVGVEIIIYWDSEVCDGADYLIVAYSYSGYEVSPSQLTDLLGMIDTAMIAALAENQNIDQDALMAMARMFTYGGGFSGGFFAVDGFDNFDDISDYSGGFQSWSVSASFNGLDGSVFHSYSSKCQAVGIKFGVSYNGIMGKKILPIDFAYSRTDYSDPVLLVEGYW